ncbi:helix-turn-helix domain-containing protein, partial [Salmonella enterica]|nr:helix-turn-helix domain-containing protein [Salmonella enterica]EGN7527250.1 helix-turn-helix domain-containing protein [Salmonella enterica]EGO6832870.1 helix-turn-helix domain-containing protein [Salmonella enterica]EGO6840257.1 helix-turn-helix domain-containing protein [Salmonella enterica]EGO6860186.1 helix-turn-helix domain-containing protein [Salmonella enterica]
KKRNRAKSKLTPAKLRRARELLKTHTAVEVAKKLGVHRSSLYKALKGFEAPTSPEL